MPVFCTKCGAQNQDFSQNCSHCYATLPIIGTRPQEKQTDYAPPFEGTYQPIQPPIYADPPVKDWQQAGADKKIIAGILGIVAGGFGIHKFILGYKKEGMIMLLVSVLSCFTLGAFMHVIGIV
jgi:hypothetical protein